MKFLESEEVDASFRDARLVILPLPYDATSTYRKGADRGPHAFLYASSQLELYDEELDSEPWRLGIHTLDPPHLDKSPAKMVETVKGVATSLLRAGKKVLGIGGEHSVSWPLIDAHFDHCKEISILQIDAHLDLRDQYGGSPFNHACVMRRASERGIPIVPVGIRAVSREEVEVARELGIEPFYARELAKDETWVERVVERLGPRVYVTFDLDGLDPSILPSTGTPVPGGLGWYKTLELLRAVGSKREVVGADIVELKPDPVQHGSEFLAALLAYKMIGYFWPTPENLT